MRIPLLLAISILLVSSVMLTTYFITGEADTGDIPDNVTGPIPDWISENNASNLTSYNNGVIYNIRSGGVDRSGLSSVAYQPNVFRSVQPIYGALPPATYDSYNILGTIAICVDIDWDPDYAEIVVAVYNSTANYLNGISAEGGSLRGWCPSSQGYDKFLVMNWYRWGVYIAYVGNLTKIYW